MRLSKAGALGLSLLIGGAARAADDAPALRLGPCGVAGGFVLPGTDGCLQIGGALRAESRWSSAASPAVISTLAPGPLPVAPRTPGLDRPGLGASARLSADLHLPTELGPLRVYLSLRGHNGLAADRPSR